VAALEETLGKAVRAKTSELRAQSRRRFWVAGAAASYAADAVFLGLFAAAGTIPPWIALAYGAAAALLSTVFFAAIATNWSLRLKDPGLVVPQALAGVAMQVGVVALAPQIAFPYLINLLTVFAFAMIWLPLAGSLLLWLVATTLSGAMILGFAGRIGVPTGSPFELTLVWLYFSLILGRCVFLSVYAAGLRARVAESRTRLAESMEQIQELATHDELTKVLNRRALMTSLEREAARTARTGAPFSVALLDLDHFKAVNDTHGHAAGDEVLKRVARIVRDTMRDTDVFGRYGGEEFMMILPATPVDAALGALERIRGAVERHDWSDVVPGRRVTVSAGVAALIPGEATGQLLGRADAALYEAKRAGRNRVRAA